MTDPTPTRVWALPDGRIAVRAFPASPTALVWLLVDHQANIRLATGFLSDEAVETTLDADKRLVSRATLDSLAAELDAATDEIPDGPARKRVAELADSLSQLSTGPRRG
ncbi:hypothetical protein ACFQ34_33635 [Pseudonocardia benzenivorans]|uniref:Uncharacterized protein n=1 Tax=Pseudonocardia benzenivorans TaxID=228005 RepID=A0ABW3VTT3_9PSEU